MRSKHIRKTDISTVILHWVLVITCRVPDD